MPEYTKRLVERMLGRPVEATLVPRRTWPFGRSEQDHDPFDARPQPPDDPAAAALAFPERRWGRPFGPTSPAAAPPADLLEPPAPPATAGRAQPGPPWPPERDAGRSRQGREPPHEASSGTSPEPPKPPGAAPSGSPATRPATEARIIGVTESASLPARVSAAEGRDAARIDAASAGPAPRVQNEAGPDRGRPDRLSPPPVVMPPAAPAEPRLVIGRLLVEVTPPPSPPVRTLPPPTPAPPRPFRAGAPSSALFRRPLGLGQG